MSVKDQDTTNITTDAPIAPPAPYAKRQTIITTLLLAPGAGLAAGLMTVVLMGILLLVAGIPTPVELFGDFTLKHIDVHTFLRLLLMFSPNSKTTPLGLALLGMLGAGIVLGLLYATLVRVTLPARGYWPGRREWLTAAAFSVAMTLIGVLLFWNELGQNHFGLPGTSAMLLTILGLLADFSLYGLVLCLAYRLLLPKQAQPGVSRASQGRRQLLSRASVAALTVGAGAGTLGLIRGYLNNYASYDGMKAYPHNNITSPITPNNEHYVVTQNVVDPAPNTDLWRLEVTGLVNTPGTYTYAEMQKLPSTSRAITLECIANGTGDHLLSTAIWQGVTLRTLLEQHGGPQAGARYAAFYSVDGYNVSLPLDELLAIDALLAWRMNGAELPQRHGFPMRVLVPGHYGEENPKWLTRVELTDHFVGGLYSDQGWYNGPLHTISRIDRPRGHVPFGQAIEVGGIAFAGNRGIQKVEVSADKGLTWQQATLQPPLSQDSWVLWTWQWSPALPGAYQLTCRATDGTGETQISHMQGTVPNGATGYHVVNTQVS
ncbi:MAG: molybdopterin-dependent oxidoreductase [Chloroflexota bacterium]|nr:molybdopterin-dependent oxidoreductase [Chloroflexota bacterium]